MIDALAYATKASARHGNSAEGTSVSDSQPEERDRRHTLTSHLFGFENGKMRLNVIDTPGHADFVADAISSMHVVECGLLCINAAAGPTFHGRRLFDIAGTAGIGRAIVLTHPDSENVNFEAVLARLREEISSTIVPVTYPNGDAAAFSAVHDVLTGDGPQAAKYREMIEERVAEADDAVLEAYLESGEMSPQDLQKYMPEAIAKHTITPLFTVSPPKEIGLKKLIAFVETYFPSPVGFGGRGASSAESDAVDQIVKPTGR